MNYLWFWIWLIWPTFHRVARIVPLMYRVWWKLGYDCGVYGFMQRAHDADRVWAYPFGNGIAGRDVFLWAMWK